LNRLADVELHLGDFNEAEQHFTRGLSILEKSYGAGHPDTAASLSGLGRLRLLTGKYDSAEAFLNQALAIEREKFGVTHLAVAEELTFLAKVHWASGDVLQAFEDSLQAEDLLRAQFGSSLRGLSEREALSTAGALFRNEHCPFDLDLDLLQGLPENAATKAWTALARSRAFVLDRMAALHRDPGRLEDSTLADLFRDLGVATNRLAAIIVRGPDPEHPDLYLPSVQRASQARDALERRLTEQSESFRTG
jgi:tetratricopeptide (TPR) repeat protein